ncbi:MAG: hypothetical protein QOJ02_2115 [Acidobacteriota bacterium]|jgi:hypothetical protein|nr:hypothetical protein [Acidobacteriota bacterium]
MKSTQLRQKLRTQVFKILLISLITFVATASAYAATIRGRLDRRDLYGKIYVAAYVGVTLYNAQLGRSSIAYTGNDGMYYFYNVPPGIYNLELWIYPGRQPLVYRIQVDNKSSTDIAPILLP